MCKVCHPLKANFKKQRVSFVSDNNCVKNCTMNTMRRYKQYTIKRRNSYFKNQKGYYSQLE